MRERGKYGYVLNQFFLTFLSIEIWFELESIYFDDGER